MPATNLSDAEREKLNISIVKDISNQVSIYHKAKRKAALDAAAERICKKIFEEYREASTLVYEFVPGDLQVINADDTAVEIKITGKIQTSQKLYDLLVNSMISKIKCIIF